MLEVSVESFFGRNPGQGILVADANRGNTAVAVLVSLERDGGALTVPHEVFVPSVVRYLPDWDVWLGANALNAAFAVV